MHTQVVKYGLLCQCNNGCTNAPQRYVIRTLPVLLFVMFSCKEYFEGIKCAFPNRVQLRHQLFVLTTPTSTNTKIIALKKKVRLWNCLHSAGEFSLKRTALTAPSCLNVYCLVRKVPCSFFLLHHNKWESYTGKRSIAEWLQLNLLIR
jgi:hypothetical protein